MAKPSIFSRDYEKKMKRRKRRITIGIILVLLVVVIAFIKFELPNIDFTEVKAKIQAWVDTGKSEEELEDDDIVEEQPEEIVKEPEKTYIDLTISEGIIAKAEYIEEQGVKKFVSLEPLEGYTFTLSPSNQQMMIIDGAQNIYLANVDGSIRDITKKEYISTSNKSYPKDQMISTNPGYLWHSQVKFIDENRIIYVTQLPYFGATATNKYLWIRDIVTNADNTLWKTKGQDIQVGEIVPDKGITVTIDGVVKYINGDGVISQ